MRASKYVLITVFGSLYIALPTLPSCSWKVRKKWRDRKNRREGRRETAAWEDGRTNNKRNGMAERWQVGRIKDMLHSMLKSGVHVWLSNAVNEVECSMLWTNRDGRTRSSLSGRLWCNNRAKQVVKVIWNKAASPPQTDGSIVFAH